MSDVDPILSLVRPAVLALKPYSSARKEFTAGATAPRAWLDANENPTMPMASLPSGMSAEAQRAKMEALAKEGFARLNRYPDPQPQELVERLAALYGVSPAQVLVTRGSDEGIDLLLRAFCSEGRDSILITPPTYGMYSVSAAIQGARVVSVPLVREKHFALDADAVIAAWQPGLKLVFLCSPNNPTGGLLSRASILKVARELEGRAMVVVDKAYIEFSGRSVLTAEIANTPNLVVLRTLSKAFGLAGARVGVTIGDPSLIAVLKKIIAPYPVPSPVAAAALAALTPAGITAARESAANLAAGRKDLAARLAALPAVKHVWPSDANFLLVEVVDAKRTMAAARIAGVVLRDRSREPGLEGCIRITTGTAEENQLVLEALSHD
ncbi:MAG TPA: histidinol-phosphate transaminase [Opitutaceae bacterium]|nr:histidinol-phosphate transaminase [Opitutaceae bacterium]